jgi:hypothetical protein
MSHASAITIMSVMSLPTLGIAASVEVSRIEPLSDESRPVVGL